jgi:hypothetical protein
MDDHRPGTEQSVGKMRLVVTLVGLVALEDGMQWRARLGRERLGLF